MPMKLTYEFIKKEIEKEGYKLLSTEYINANTKLKIKCDKGHKFRMRWSSFQQGQRCPIERYIRGSSKIKLTYEYVKEQIEKEGYQLLSHEYENCMSKIKIICDKGHEYKVTYNHFKNGKRCPICYKENNKGKNSGNWKGGVIKKNIPLYDTYAHQIEYAEHVRRSKDNVNILEVKCGKCKKWYIPELRNVKHRIESLNGKTNGENRFYCSKKCKQQCSIFWKRNYQIGHPKSEENRPYQQEWSKMVCKRENYTCEICGEYGNIAHHEIPVKIQPLFQADVDNGICLCENCHIIHGHKDECSASNLASLIC